MSHALLKMSVHFSDIFCVFDCLKQFPYLISLKVLKTVFSEILIIQTSFEFLTVFFSQKFGGRIKPLRKTVILKYNSS